jgi:hypothetical protein
VWKGKQVLSILNESDLDLICGGTKPVMPPGQAKKHITTLTGTVIIKGGHNTFIDSAIVGQNSGTITIN